MCEQLKDKLIVGCIVVNLLCGTITTAAQKKQAQGRRTPSAAAAVATTDESRLKAELERIREYPPPDRIKRLRFFIKSHPKSSLIETAKEALNAALVENGETPEPLEKRESDVNATTAATATEVTPQTEDRQPTETVVPTPDNSAGKTASDAKPADDTAQIPVPSQTQPQEPQQQPTQPTQETSGATESVANNPAAATATAINNDNSGSAMPSSAPSTTEANPKLQAELERIMEYPPPDRIKRLRFFIKSHPDSPLTPTAKEALDAALNPASAASAATQIATAAEIEEKKSADVANSNAVETANTTVARADETSNANAATNGEASSPAKETRESETDRVKTKTSAGDKKGQAALSSILALPADERIAGLQDFLKTNSATMLAPTATEALVAALAESGDAKLQSGDTADGLAQFRAAVELAPANMSDKLFAVVIAKIPTNLYVRNQPEAALEAARNIEPKINRDAKRLLALASFYLGLEQANDAARLAQQALTLAPEMAAAHQALGAAYHVDLRLDDAVAEYTRALELDAKLAGARRSLADLLRATGQAEKALALYREVLAVESKDNAARAGLVLSLYNLGKKDDAERELAAALQDEPRNLQLLVGAAYWYDTQADGARALDLAGKAVAIEPRYTWAQIALARSLLLQNRFADAERSLRFAQQYGRFPTLDYELADALAAGGFYDEAAVELQRSFAWQKGSIATRLAGRKAATGANFIELLAPERRAGIYQPNAADTESNARMLKGLLALATAVSASDFGDGEAAIAATQDFVGGGDETTRALRRLYAATALQDKGIAPATVFELTEAATTGVEAALDTPQATTAILASELHDVRAQAIASGGTPNLPALPRELLSKILRGRLEMTAGWALFNLDKPSDAVVRLRRAASVLPENSVWWRTALWRLGASLDAGGNKEEALASYIKSYQRGAPDQGRRAVIENLYRKINGSLDGLDEKIGPPLSTSSSQLNETPAKQPEH